VSGVLAAAAVTLDGPRLLPRPVGQGVPRSDKHRVQASLDRVFFTRPITFAPDSVDLVDPRELREVAGILGAAPPGMTFEVGGHAAARPGSEATALRLSRARAEKVTDALTAAGVPAARLVPKGYGDASPNERGNDRRVEIVVR
jgi:outer membrane protein OmpA-like peptidoglycan-associated protein